MAMLLSELGNNSGFVYVTKADGTTILADIANNSDAWQKLQEYANASVDLTSPTIQVNATFGFRFFGNTTGVAGSLAGSSELTRFIVNRASQSARYKASATIAAGIITIDRVSNDMLLVVDTEGLAASDDLEVLNLNGVVDNDTVTIVGNNAARIVRIITGGNFTVSGSVDFFTADSASEITVRWFAASAMWFEVSRGMTAPDVAALRATTIPQPISGVNLTTLGAGGGTINVEAGVDKGTQVYNGTAVLVGSWVIQPQAAPATPYLDGEEIWVDYRALLTQGGNTVTIFGITLTATQALEGRVIVRAKYRLADTTWYSSLFYRPNGLDITNKAYVDATFENDLGNPAADGYVLSSTAVGVRSWIPNNASGVLLYSALTTVANPADIVENTLATYTLPANTINVNGQGIRITASGDTGATANAKTIRIKVDNSSVLVNSNTPSPNALAWKITGEIWRVSSAVQRTSLLLTFIDSTGAVITMDFPQSSAVEDWTTDLPISFTAQNGVALPNEIRIHTFTVERIIS